MSPDRWLLASKLWLLGAGLWIALGLAVEARAVFAQDFDATFSRVLDSWCAGGTTLRLALSCVWMALTLALGHALYDGHSDYGWLTRWLRRGMDQGE